MPCVSVHWCPINQYYTDLLHIYIGVHALLGATDMYSLYAICTHRTSTKHALETKLKCWTKCCLFRCGTFPDRRKKKKKKKAFSYMFDVPMYIRMTPSVLSLLIHTSTHLYTHFHPHTQARTHTHYTDCFIIRMSNLQIPYEISTCCLRLYFQL